MILKLLQEAQRKEEHSFSYDEAMNYVRDKLVNEAKEKVRGEINSLENQLLDAQSAIKRVENERDSEISLRVLSDRKINELLSEINILKNTIAENNRKLAMNSEDLNNAIIPLKNELDSEKQKTRDLEVQIATLTGRLKEIESRPQPIVKEIKPIQIPSFEAKPVRGPDGRTISVTLTPVGAYQ